MKDSILNSIKCYVGVVEVDTAFDQEILMNINSVFSTLNQIGAGPVSGFLLRGADETWNSAFPDYSNSLISLIKQYTQLKVRVFFDPPSSANVMEAINRQISELEWRINFEAEGGLDSDE